MTRGSWPLQDLFLWISQVHWIIFAFTCSCYGVTHIFLGLTVDPIRISFCLLSFFYMVRLGTVHILNVSSQMMMKVIYHSCVLHWLVFLTSVSDLEKKDGKEIAIMPRLSHVGYHMERQKQRTVSHAQIKNLWKRHRRRRSRGPAD